MPLIALHPGQLRVVKERERWNVLQCGRRFGKTKLGIRLAVDEALKGQPVGWFAPTYKLQLDVWEEMCRMLKPVITRASSLDQRISLEGGGVIDFWSMDGPDPGRGRKYRRVIIDEASISKDLAAAWQGAIRPTLTDLKGDAWFLGTPKGCKHFFNVMFLRGQQGDKGYKSWRFHTGDNPYIDPAELAGAKRDLPPEIYAQEYEGVPAADGGNPFGLAAIAACIIAKQSDEPAVCYGVDLAKSQDWTVIVGLDAAGRVCYLDRWQGDWGNTRRKILAQVADVKTLVDSTGVGDPIVEDMQKERRNIEGFKFSSLSKQQLMEGLAAAIQKKETGYPNGWLREELDTFEYEYTLGGRVTYTAPSGLHDDGVCALALAVRCRGVDTSGGVLPFSIASFDSEKPGLESRLDREEIWGN